MISFKISCADVAVSVCTGLSGLPYALRHFEAANQPQANVWGHRMIGVIECIPILGGLVALIEALVASCFASKTLPPNPPPKNPPSNKKTVPLVPKQSMPQQPAQVNLQTVEQHLALAEVSVHQTQGVSAVISEVSFDD